MGNAMLAFAPIAFFAATGLIACGVLGWMLHDMLPLLKPVETVDLRAAARRAARVQTRRVPTSRPLTPRALRPAVSLAA